MITITLCTRQQKRHWCIEQSYGLCGRGRGWDDLGEWHWNMYNIYETSRQSRFDTRYWMLGAGALERPRGMVWGGRREEGSGWGTHVYLWWIHLDIWQNQYNIVKLNKIKLTKNWKKKKVVYNSYSSFKRQGKMSLSLGKFSLPNPLPSLVSLEAMTFWDKYPKHSIYFSSFFFSSTTLGYLSSPLWDWTEYILSFSKP